MFFTCKNAIIFFLQFYRLSAICLESDDNEDDALVSNKADAFASLNAAATYLDKFVLLSHAQNVFINQTFGKSKSQTSYETDKNLVPSCPILLRSGLSRAHTYAVVLTPNYNLNFSCCKCECHPKEKNCNI